MWLVLKTKKVDEKIIEENFPLLKWRKKMFIVCGKRKTNDIKKFEKENHKQFCCGGG